MLNAATLKHLDVTPDRDRLEPLPMQTVANLAVMSGTHSGT